MLLHNPNYLLINKIKSREKIAILCFWNIIISIKKKFNFLKNIDI